MISLALSGSFALIRSITIITPFMSMIREIVETGIDREVHLLYGCRNEEVAIFHKDLTEIAKNHKNF